MRRWMPLLIAVAMVVPVARIAYGKGTYSYMGAGAMSCGEFIKADHLRMDAIQWVLGFVTAINVTRSFNAEPDENVNIMNGANADAIELWLTNYCNENPLDSLTTATTHLVDKAIKKLNKR